MWRVTSRSTGIKMAKFGLVQVKIKCNVFAICKKTLAKSEIHAESLEQKGSTKKFEVLANKKEYGHHIQVPQFIYSLKLVFSLLCKIICNGSRKRWYLFLNH
jgi:hypothetical protein